MWGIHFNCAFLPILILQNQISLFPRVDSLKSLVQHLNLQLERTVQYKAQKQLKRRDFEGWVTQSFKVKRTVRDSRTVNQRHTSKPAMEPGREMNGKDTRALELEDRDH